MTADPAATASPTGLDNPDLVTLPGKSKSFFLEPPGI